MGILGKEKSRQGLLRIPCRQSLFFPASCGVFFGKEKSRQGVAHLLFVGVYKNEAKHLYTFFLDGIVFHLI